MPSAGLDQQSERAAPSRRAGPRIRAAAGLVVVALAAGIAGHLLDGRAAATQVSPTAVPTTKPPTDVPPAAAPNSATQGTHILWLVVHGRWRAVPS